MRNSWVKRLSLIGRGWTMPRLEAWNPSGRPRIGTRLPNAAPKAVVSSIMLIEFSVAYAVFDVTVANGSS